MLILLSPAKTLDFDTPFDEVATKPRFATDASRLARAAAKLGPARLARTDAHFRRPRRRSTTSASRASPGPTSAPRSAPSPATSIAASMPPAPTTTRSPSRRIICASCRACTACFARSTRSAPTGSKWARAGRPTATSWSTIGATKVAKALAADLRADGSKTAGQPRQQRIFCGREGPVAQGGAHHRPRLPRRTPPRACKFQSFTAKVARGAMARWLCDERVADPAALPDFDRDGWRLRRRRIDPDKPLFVKR